MSGPSPKRKKTASTKSSCSMNAAKSPKDRKSTRLNSSHANISYAVFCLKKKKLKATLFSLIYGACRRLGYEARFHPLLFNDPSIDTDVRRLSNHPLAVTSLIGMCAYNGS